MARLPAHSGGYTLLELVLVLAILAIALGAVAPSLSGFGFGRRAEEAAGQFVTLAHWAHDQAVADGQTYRLIVDKSAGQWYVRMEDQGTLVAIDGRFGRTFDAPEGVAVDTDATLLDGLPSIAFDPTGRCDLATIRFIGQRGAVEVTCDTIIGDYHIVTTAEASR